ncbi:MAG TPA: threonine aldolase family protein [Rhodopila sp.]|uniref:threonine aldolase family protein n=1 Tax=Rhodopila sp. TaxID=2480087 RepID=UPI002C47FB9D|nr:threonine aldolase family protein [Rhodopila sp.]HVY17135.1 threonine aldolase family protein [Rhodopila sp.]
MRVNLYSDTQTRPSPAMKEAMMRAEVGDEQHGDDPTIDALCDRMTALTGKEAAMFLPSGTMCNQVAILTHCRPGDEILAHEHSHILINEGGGPGALAGASVRGLRGARGMFDAAAIDAAWLEPRRNAPPQTLLEVEQTANAGGGSVWPLELLTSVTDAAHRRGMRTHMDGARLMNAVVASGVATRDMVAGCDSVWLDFTKGLGAPLGAVLCGPADFIDAAWRWKQRLGGSLRQAGICAAACLYALDHNVDRLAEDHANARTLARGLAQVPGLAVEEPETNLVFFDTSATGLTADALADRVRLEGVMLSTVGPYRVRACTHLDVDAEGVDYAMRMIGKVLGR